MESDVLQSDSAFKGKDQKSNHEADVEEILRKAGLEEDSEEEYLSAEENSDTDPDTLLVCNETDIPKDATFERDDTILPNSDTEDNDNDNNQDTDKDDKMAVRQREEDLLTAEEREERRNTGQKLKAEGNTKFRDGEFDEATEAYTEALEICPLNFQRDRAIMFANRAACKMKKELYQAAIEDSTAALELHPQYLKALLRRAELYEKSEKLDEALKDYEKLIELDPPHHTARSACIRLAEQIKERNEKMKEEMIGKLKDLGNLVLRPFGLNVNNFNLQQDPNTGSYSVQFHQNAPGNGS